MIPIERLYKLLKIIPILMVRFEVAFTSKRMICQAERLMLFQSIGIKYQKCLLKQSLKKVD